MLCNKTILIITESVTMV